MRPITFLSAITVDVNTRQVCLMHFGRREYLTLPPDSEIDALMNGVVMSIKFDDEDFLDFLTEEELDGFKQAAVGFFAEQRELEYMRRHYDELAATCSYEEIADWD